LQSKRKKSWGLRGMGVLKLLTSRMGQARNEGKTELGFSNRKKNSNGTEGRRGLGEQKDRLSKLERVVTRLVTGVWFVVWDHPHRNTPHIERKK